MNEYYRTQGLVISKNNLREADQLFSVYTKDFGKVEILGKAIRKIKSKLRAGIELFYFSEVEFIQGKFYKTLTDAVTIEKFRNIRGDLDKMKIAYQIAETVDALIHCQEKDENIFNLLKETFNKLNNSLLPTTNYSLIYYYFFWNFVSLLGYEIDLYRCAFCQKKLVPGNFCFNPKEGEIICSDCVGGIKETLNVSPEAIKIIRLFLKNDWLIIFRLKIEKPYLESLKEISQNYFVFLKSCGSLTQINMTDF